jgi:hypothetical protein
MQNPSSPSSPHSVGVDYTQESEAETFGTLAREFGVEPQFVQALVQRLANMR